MRFMTPNATKFEQLLDDIGTTWDGLTAGKKKQLTTYVQGLLAMGSISEDIGWNEKATPGFAEMPLLVAYAETLQRHRRDQLEKTDDMMIDDGWRAEHKIVPPDNIAAILYRFVEFRVAALSPEIPQHACILEAVRKHNLMLHHMAHDYRPVFIELVSKVPSLVFGDCSITELQAVQYLIEYTCRQGSLSFNKENTMHCLELIQAYIAGRVDAVAQQSLAR